MQSFGQELVMTNVDLSVAGTYECQAVNDQVQPTEPPVSARFQLDVECKLFHCLY